MATKDVLHHHLAAFGAGDVDEILKDYTDDSVLITADGTIRGLEALREAFTASSPGCSRPGPTSSRWRPSHVEGEVALHHLARGVRLGRYPAGRGHLPRAGRKDRRPDVHREDRPAVAQSVMVMCPGWAATRREPRAHGRVGLERDAALLGDVRVGVERDVGDGEALAHQEVAVGEVGFPSPGRSPVGALLLRLQGLARRAAPPSTCSQKRPTARFGSWSYCSKNIHWSTWARS